MGLDKHTISVYTIDMDANLDAGRIAMTANMTTISEAHRIVGEWAGSYEMSEEVQDTVARSLVKHCGGFTDRGCELTEELSESFDLLAEINKAEVK